MATGEDAPQESDEKDYVIKQDEFARMSNHLRKMHIFLEGVSVVIPNIDLFNAGLAKLHRTITKLDELSAADNIRIEP